LFVSARKLREQWSQHRKPVLGSSPDKDGFCSSETKHDIITGLRQKSVCFEEEITGTEVTKPKTVLVSGIGVDSDFRDNNFFYDIQRYVSNTQAYDKL
jgi:hypothetical protein